MIFLQYSHMLKQKEVNKMSEIDQIIKRWNSLSEKGKAEARRRVIPRPNTKEWDLLMSDIDTRIEAALQQAERR